MTGLAPGGPGRDPNRLQIMVLERPRIAYLPIAKNACSTLKAEMVALSDLPDAQKAELLAGDIHQATDEGDTGLLLKDRAPDDAARLLTEPGWMRFAVVREPVDRLVSAYVEKFVIRRERKRVATAPVIAAIRGVAEPGDAEFARGIRFAEFLEHLLAHPPETHDPHWRPQSLSLSYMSCTHLYAMEHLDRLAEDLAARTGRKVTLGVRNRHRAETGTVVPGAADLWPEEIGDPRPLHPASFVDAQSRAAIEEYFAADVTIYRAAKAARA